jgi:tyrosinase
MNKTKLTFCAEWSTRKTDIGGPDTMWAYPYNWFGDVPYKNITLDFQLAYGQLGATVNISQVMDTTSGVLCYTYA